MSTYIAAEASTAKSAQRDRWRATYQRCTRLAAFARVNGDHKGAALLEERAKAALTKLASYV